MNNVSSQKSREILQGYEDVGHILYICIKEAIIVFGRASRGEWVGESHTWCIVLCEIKLYNSWN